jgi:hypothetical protein
MTVTMSGGVCVTTCICRPPTLRTANRKAAATTPAGRARPRRASAIASNPKPDEKPEARLGVALAS